jgi:hypothetical protein
MEFNGFEDERMFLERWFTKCDEKSINICRDMPGAYAGLIAHERRLACLGRKQTHEHTYIKIKLIELLICNCNTSLIMTAV